MNYHIAVLTIEEKINLSILEGDDIPALIVEGTSDVRIYGRLLTKSTISSDKYDIIIGKCKTEILKYHYSGLPFKYVALIDADYDHFNHSCINDNRILYTHFYTMENYLTLEEVLSQTIEDLKTIHSPNITSKEILNRAILSIEPIIVACLLKQDNKWPIKIEDCSVEDLRWWNGKSYSIDYNKFKSYLYDRFKDNSITLDSKEFDIQYSLKKHFINTSSSIDIFAHGKHKLRSVFYVFKQVFPVSMDKRDVNVFIGDLCKNLFKSTYALDLVSKIDNKLLTLISN